MVSSTTQKLYRKLPNASFEWGDSTRPSTGLILCPCAPSPSLCPGTEPNLVSLFTLLNLLSFHQKCICSLWSELCGVCQLWWLPFKGRVNESVVSPPGEGGAGLPTPHLAHHREVPLLPGHGQQVPHHPGHRDLGHQAGSVRRNWNGNC